MGDKRPYKPRKPGAGRKPLKPDYNAAATEYIKAQPGWEFVGIYDDEGISGTSLEHRKGMQQLIEDCTQR